MKNDLPFERLKKFDIIILLQYLIGYGITFDDIIFIPNIFSKAEHTIVHDVYIESNKVIISVSYTHLTLPTIYSV